MERRALPSISKIDVQREINAFALELMRIGNASDLFWHVAQNVVGRMGFEDCVVYLVDDSGDALVQVAAIGPKNPVSREIKNKLRIPLGTGITGTVAASGEAVVIDDLSLDTRYVEDIEPALSEICVPLKIGNRIAGVIDCEHLSRAAFGEKDLEVLTTVAAMTSVKLQLLEEADAVKRHAADLAAANTRLEQEMSERVELEKRLSEARRLEAIGRLSGGMAHDFNNLLSVIVGTLQLYHEIPDMSEKREVVQEAERAAIRGAKLISQLLRYARQSPLEVTRVDLSELIIGVTETARRLIPASTHLVPLVPTQTEHVEIDPIQLEASILNLISNASDAIKENGLIEVALNYETLAIDEISGHCAVIQIKDNGCGISSADIDKVTEPFFSTKEVGRGTGLGLASVSGFAKQSGGHFAIESDEGVGTLATIFIPVAH